MKIYSPTRRRYYRVEPIRQRFFKYVKKTPSCWEWVGAKDTAGYGKIILSRLRRYRVVSAHRLSYALSIGPIGDGVKIIHKCDNRSCVRPAHLSAGTQRDNMIDMAKKHRAAKKLRESDVKEIRKRIESDWKDTPQHVIAKRFGVSQNTISHLVRKVTWAYS